MVNPSASRSASHRATRDRRRPKPGSTSRTSAQPELPPSDPEEAARFAGLRWVNDLRPGITRRRRGKGFSYVSPTGDPITDPDRLAWIRSIVIPPAWTDVWISPVQNGHIQASGRDARGRKQYRYHVRWREVRDSTKYTHLIEFAQRLPRIRRRAKRDLGLTGLPRNRVLAVVVLLLDRTFIRIGNEEYARLNESFGLTTMRNKHVKVKGTQLRFRFRGKSGKVHDVDLRDRRLATLVQRIQDLPGQDLFSYVDEDGTVQDVASDDVNDYLREVAGPDITAKDFRTWAGTVLAFRALCQLWPVASETEARRNIVAAIRDVARRLGNTPAVCRKSYIHPAILDSYVDGSLGERLLTTAHSEGDGPPEIEPDEEAAVLALLRHRVRSGHAAPGTTRTSAA